MLPKKTDLRKNKYQEVALKKNPPKNAIHPRLKVSCQSKATMLVFLGALGQSLGDTGFLRFLGLFQVIMANPDWVPKYVNF